MRETKRELPRPLPPVPLRLPRQGLCDEQGKVPGPPLRGASPPLNPGAVDQGLPILPLAQNPSWPPTTRFNVAVSAPTSISRPCRPAARLYCVSDSGLRAAHGPHASASVTPTTVGTCAHASIFILSVKVRGRPATSLHGGRSTLSSSTGGRNGRALHPWKGIVAKHGAACAVP